MRAALSETAELLESLARSQTLAMMNAGAPLEEIARARCAAPAHLLARPYLQPIYDEPEFIVRNVWRLYGGWWDGDPSTLKPAPAAALARGVAALAGGAAALADARRGAARRRGSSRSRATWPRGGARGAGRRRRRSRRGATIYRARAEAETSLMARGIFAAAAREGGARGGEES